MRARTKLAVPSLIALLAMLLIPTIGRAETSSETVYHLGPPGLESEGPGPERLPERHPRHGAKPKHDAKPKPDAPSTGHDPEPTTDPETEEDRPGVAAPGPGDGPPPDSAGDPGPRGTAPTKTLPGTDRKPVTNFTPGPDASVSNQADASSGGGTSPVVPVLIAVTVLAALSIGVTLRRGRSAA